VIKEEALGYALRKLTQEEVDNEEIWMQNAFKRWNRIGGDRWVSGFLARHDVIKTSKKKRPIERERAMKTQPENVLQHFRNVNHGYALCQMQRKKAANPSCCPGWVIQDGNKLYSKFTSEFICLLGLITRENGGGRKPGDDVLELRTVNGEEVIWVKPLGEALERLDLNHLIALDEKPLMPDVPTSKILSSIGVKHLIGTNRSASWTLTPVITASGQLIASQVIVRGIKIDSATIRQLGEKRISIFSRESGYQDEKSFEEFAEIWTKKLSTSIDNPGIVIVDGHTSHMSRRFQTICANAFLFPIVEPSQLSILVQAGDNGVNAAIEQAYKKEYSTRFTSKKGFLTNEDRLQCVILALDACIVRIKCSFREVGLTGHPNGQSNLWKKEDFIIGHPFRDSSLPIVTNKLLSTLFSPLNLVIPWGWEYFREEESPPDREEFEENLRVMAEQEMGGYSGSFVAYQIEKGEVEDRANIIGEKVYKLAPSISRVTIQNTGAKLSVSIGCFIADENAAKVSEEKERRKKEKEEKEKESENARKEKEVKEKPMRDILLKLGYIQNETDNITVKVLKEFHQKHDSIPWPLPYPKSGHRGDQVGVVLLLIEKKNRGEINFEWVNK
jgi:hypothetical protein